VEVGPAVSREMRVDHRSQSGDTIFE